MMKFQLIKKEWQKEFEKMSRTPGFARIARQQMGVEHYKAIMREIYYHARENPQIQALATVYFRGKQREMVKGFFKHATSEIGHDQLALNDLKALEEDVTDLPYLQPLPATTALIGYAFYQIQHLNPLGYLGYLFHLEFMPTQGGKEYMKAFQAAGVPEEALSFVKDHATIDIGHNKLMERYIDELVQTPEDIDAVVHAARVTAYLYGAMVQQAFESVDYPSSTYVAHEEAKHLPSREKPGSTLMLPGNSERSHHPGFPGSFAG